MKRRKHQIGFFSSLLPLKFPNIVWCKYISYPFVMFSEWSSELARVDSDELCTFVVISMLLCLAFVAQFAQKYRVKTGSLWTVLTWTIYSGTRFEASATMVTQIVTTPLCKDTGTTVWDLQNLFAWLEVVALVLVVAKVSFVIANLWCFMWVLYTSGQDSVPPSRMPGYHARFGADRSDLKSRLLKVGKN